MSFIRRPLTWLLVAEVVVVAALGAAAWEVFVARAASTPATARAAEPPGQPNPRVENTGPRASPIVPLTTASPRRAGPTPGLNASPAFLSRQLSAINHDQAAWERSEWSILQAGLGFARDYLEKVVLPAVRSAEASGRAG